MTAPNKWGRLCASCDTRLDATALARNYRWCASCRCKRRNPVTRAATGARYYARHRAAECARSAAYYAACRDVLALKQRARHAQRIAQQRARRAA